ncbi:MAG: hypothetical protein M5U26_02595 [Planctomycetota bacterium]|nr:hypothetical protein [Planctomycetota bacterium]
MARNAEETVAGASQCSQPLTATDGARASGNAQSARARAEGLRPASAHAAGVPSTTARSVARPPTSMLRPSAANRLSNCPPAPPPWP